MLRLQGNFLKIQLQHRHFILEKMSEQMAESPEHGVNEMLVVRSIVRPRC